MIRTGRPRTRHAPRDRRVSVFAAAVMLLFLLGASLLVSAGSEHHAQASAAVSAADAVDAQPASGHEHHHGNGWAPTLSKRLRPAATTVCYAVPVRPPATDQAFHQVNASERLSSGDALTALGVLRV
ncbi:hypothetical protein DMB66_58010 [Actinoplanes sp. ATCC 53533]|uniref:hypothetical protein n=1 Tax=Actinoplanes sp. ATCC 53533 TaxID=1288362 RepID=UPI000F773385|nr:hypothetical protein [Actinoplanes sp. ATCC 53533]RSM39720.1 hypothetical protein DMB66_58010 [Actinoplanes sp. ATCC 53533]